MHEIRGTNFWDTLYKPSKIRENSPSSFLNSVRKRTIYVENEENGLHQITYLPKNYLWTNIKEIDFSTAATRYSIFPDHRS